MHDILYITIPLFAGLILDAVLGDPVWLPHPIRWFGKAVELMERRFNKGAMKKLKGLFVVLFLIAITAALFFAVMQIVRENQVVYYPVASLLVFYGLANRNLLDEAVKVNRKLTREGLEAGRLRLSRIVGRDTTQLSGNQVRLAMLETLSENLSDGVIAPLFYYFIGGIPLMFVYKMVNTMDSMIGYKSSKYKEFGYFAAMIDDILNYLPARITAVLIALSGVSMRGLQFIFKYGSKHSSPNAGYPEAALAGVLNCRFGGPNYYQGELVEKPWIGENEKQLSKKELHSTIRINIIVTIIFSIVCTGLLIVT